MRGGGTVRPHVARGGAFGSDSSLFGYKPLNVLGIFAVGVLGRTLLKSILGGAATPAILLLLAGYVYYLKTKEQEKQEINKQNLNNMTQNLSNMNNFASVYGAGGLGKGTSFSSKLHGSNPNATSSSWAKPGNRSISSSSYNLSSTPLNGGLSTGTGTAKGSCFEESLRELDNRIYNRFGPQSGTIKITKKERRRIQGIYDKQFVNRKSKHSTENNANQSMALREVETSEMDNNKKGRRLYKGRTRKRRHRKLTTTIKYAE